MSGRFSEGYPLKLGRKAHDPSRNSTRPDRFAYSPKASRDSPQPELLPREHPRGERIRDFGDGRDGPAWYLPP